MEPSTYNAFADMLAKFHTSSAAIQALWLVAVPGMVFGMTWCLSWVLRDAILAAAGRRGFALDLEALDAGTARPELSGAGGADGPLRLARPAGAAAAPDGAGWREPQTSRDTFAADPSSQEDGGQAPRDRLP
jgi:hypothetical protein